MNAERDYAAEERMRGAAKEMYDALAAITSKVSPWILESNPPCFELTVTQAQLNAARFALAKAEGRS